MSIWYVGSFRIGNSKISAPQVAIALRSRGKLPGADAFGSPLALASRVFSAITPEKGNSIYSLMLPLY